MASWTNIATIVGVLAVVFKFYMYLTTGRYKVKKNLSERTILITGGTSGIGKETVKILCSHGANVHILARDLKKATHLIEELKATGLGSTSTIEAHHVDLSSFESIRRFAKEYLASGRPVHVLINNAATLNVAKKTTVDGNDEICQVNYLGHFLLTNLLLPRLIESGPGSRIINVASLSHTFVKEFDIGDLNFARRPYSMLGIAPYMHSKVAVVMWTRQLAKRLEGSGVTANSLHPGDQLTPLYRQFAWYRPYKLFLHVMKFFLKSPSDAAQTGVFLAVSDRVQHVNGQYFSDCAPSVFSFLAMDDQKAEALWNESEKLCESGYAL